MRGPNLVTGLLVTFAGIAALMGLLGVLYSPVTLGVAVPFALAAGILWYQATGRLQDRVRRTAGQDAGPRGRPGGVGAGRDASAGARGPRFGGSRFREPPSGDGFRDASYAGSDDPGGGTTGRGNGPVAGADGPSRAEARRLLDVGPDASQAELRRAYRDRAKELHPDHGGDESAFRRVTRAYERLRE